MVDELKMGLGRKGNNSMFTAKGNKHEEIRDQKSSTSIDSVCRVQCDFHTVSLHYKEGACML